MTVVVFMVGAVVAAVLLGGLVATLLVPPLRIWPTPGPGTWQSYVFWISVSLAQCAVLRGGRGRRRQFPRPPAVAAASSPSG